MVATIARQPASGSLAEVVDIILDKGLVIDAYARVSLVGIELLTLDARVVVASVDTYLHFAEAVNRLDLRAEAEEYDTSLQDLIGDMGSSAAEGKVEGAIEGAQSKAGEGVEKVRSVFSEQESGGGSEDDSGGESEES
jgi:gas vesicle structural protein